MGDIINRFWSI